VIEMYSRHKKTIYTLAVFLILLQAAIFLYFRDTLVPGFDELTWPIKAMSLALLPIYVILGLFHLSILFELLKSISNQYKNPILLSGGVILVTLSGITLLSDITILSDIGKEYLYFSVDNEWLMLFGFTVFHMLTLTYIYLISSRINPATVKLIDTIKEGNDQMFKSLYQIVGISGLLGSILTLLFLFNVLDFLTYESYLTGFMFLISALILLPVFLYLAYWLIKFRKVSFKNWFDEMQWRVSANGITLSLIWGWLLGTIGVFLSVFGITISLIYWSFLVFFSQLAIIAVYVLLEIRDK